MYAWVAALRFIKTTRMISACACPSLEDLVIIIPLHIEHCHWVVIIRKKTEEGVTFFHADDMNSQISMENIKT